MVSLALVTIFLAPQTATVSYEYVGKISGRQASLTLDWPKGSGHKTAEKLTGTFYLSGGAGTFYSVRGTNQAKGRMVLQLWDEKKRQATLRFMRDKKKSGVWTGDYYLPKRKPIAVTFRATGPVEYGC
jgi:hypothetical protein